MDNCPDLANPTQTDLNGNAVGDACECTAASLVIDGENALDLLAWRARGAGDVDEDGYNDLFIGVPVVLGEKGMERVVEMKLDDHEKGLLDNSASAVKELVAALRLE